MHIYPNTCFLNMYIVYKKLHTKLWHLEIITFLNDFRIFTVIFIQLFLVILIVKVRKEFVRSGNIECNNVIYSSYYFLQLIFIAL